MKMSRAPAMTFSPFRNKQLPLSNPPQRAKPGPKRRSMERPIMSPTCTILGTPDLYGLGIRISFYLLWYFVLLGERCHERHAQVPRALELVFAYAVFLGLITAVAGGYLFAAEVYISLLLISTTVYLLVPRHTTDVLGCFRQDIRTRGRRNGFGAVAAARSMFVLAVISLHIWFWTVGVSSEDIDRSLRSKGAQDVCQAPQQVGFAFGPMELSSPGFRALNFLQMLTILIGGVIMGAMQTGLLLRKPRCGPWARRGRSRYGGTPLSLASRSQTPR